MKKAASAEQTKSSHTARSSDVAALEGVARQGGASSADETTLSLRSSAATQNGDPAGLLRHEVPCNDKSSLTLWLWVSVGFLLLAVAWTILFTVARSAKIETVPRATTGGGTR